MMYRNLVLSGAALAASALIAGPVYAQWGNSYPSTPAERAETAELNRNGVQEIHPTPSEQAAYEQAQSDYRARLNAYNEQQRAQMDAYAASQSAYDAERQAYENELAAANAREDRYVEEVLEPFDNENINPEDVARLERLETFVDNGAPIANSPVEDRFGRYVGRFRHMQLDRDGLPTAIITLNNQRTVQVPADDLRFDPERDTVLADLSYGELERMRQS